MSCQHPAARPQLLLDKRLAINMPMHNACSSYCTLTTSAGLVYYREYCCPIAARKQDVDAGKRIEQQCGASLASAALK